MEFTVTIPDWITTPTTIADFAFGEAMEHTYGPIEKFNDSPLDQQMDACRQLNLYFGAGDHVPSDEEDRKTLQDVLLYIESVKSVEVLPDEVFDISWIEYISDNKES